MTDTSDTRALAEALARQDAAALAATLHARGVSPTAVWRDCFDAADDLLDAASVDRALAALTRTTLRRLADAATDADGGIVADDARREASALALLRDDGRPFRAVATRVRAALSEYPDAFTPAPPTPPVPAADAAQTAAAAQRAADATGALADLLTLSTEQPLRTTGAGTVTAGDRKRMVEAGVVDDGAELADLVALGSAAALLSPVGREWLPTPAGDEWIRQPTVTRWVRVATAWRDTLPTVLRTPDGGFTPPARWGGVLPLDAQWPHHTTLLRRRARRWGIAAGEAEPAWSTPLRRGAAPDAEALRAALPAEIDRIYLQADLTAIAPGTLRADLELRLRSMAVRESHAQASTYRFTDQTLSAALTDGQTAAGLRAFLHDLSLTGIPQPLDYLIVQTAERHGLVRVASRDDDPGGARVSSVDTRLLRTMAVDRSLRALRLSPDGDGLVSPVGRDAVYWALADARYPVAAVDAAGRIEPLHRRRAAAPPAAAGAPAAALLPLATRMLRANGDDADAAWLARELDRAVHDRADVVVTVRMPDGGQRDFALEPTGLGGGRLRGRDRAAEIERTVPVRSILRVRSPAERPAPEPSAPRRPATPQHAPVE